ncbi:hypothetical protein K443DRAFT_677142 [Laccaria amethystina LaAM-08-1]|uniref:Uncharacterized protein n=1 Tax=Laccaria amethystina LaAM-08-1 TaxID=1095629 RepID=A0A0C9Y4H0_9AGAR|nr:hypothetical protein K443DRAFT_677142 [Laccaria amethystina LaAM-08-1]
MTLELRYLKIILVVRVEGIYPDCLKLPNPLGEGHEEHSAGMPRFPSSHPAYSLALLLQVSRGIAFQYELEYQVVKRLHTSS